MKEFHDFAEAAWVADRERRIQKILRGARPGSIKKSGKQSFEAKYGNLTLPRGEVHRIFSTRRECAEFIDWCSRFYGTTPRKCISKKHLRERERYRENWAHCRALRREWNRRDRAENPGSKKLEHAFYNNLQAMFPEYYAQQREMRRGWNSKSRRKCKPGMGEYKPRLTRRMPDWSVRGQDVMDYRSKYLRSNWQHAEAISNEAYVKELAIERREALANKGGAW